MSVTLTWRGEQVVANIRQELSRRVERCTTETRTQVVRNISKSGRGFTNGSPSNVSRPGQFPTANRGILRNAIFSEMVEELTGRIGVDAASPAKKYARRLEEGGVIQSHGKRMAIPISPQAKSHSMGGGGPRTLGIPLTRIARAGKPMLLVEIKGGKRSRKPWIIHYVLTDRVTILARPFLSRTVMEMTPRYKAILEAPFKP